MELVPESVARENAVIPLAEGDGRLTRELQFVKNLRERFPQAVVKDASSMIWELRSIKSPAEIEQLRKVGRLGVEASFGESQADFRPGEEVSVQPCFQTSDGLVIATVYRGESASEEGRRSVSGQVLLMKADGTVLSSGTTGFG